MLDRLYPLLSHPWGSVAIALSVAAIGLVPALGLRRLRRGSGSPWVRFATILGILASAFSAILFLGAVMSLIELGRLAREYPPPGARVDVGGYRMHILAEGDALPAI